MLYLVNDVLDFSQIEAKKFLLNYEEIDIHEIIKDCQEILGFKAEAKGIALKSYVEDDVPKYIFTDRNRVR